MEWTTIGTGIALLAVLAPLIIYTNSSLRNEVKAALAELRAELGAEIQGGDAALRADMANLRADLQQDMANLRADMVNLRADLQQDMANLRADMVNLRADLQQDMANLRADLKADNASLKAELKADIAGLRLEVRSNRAEIITNRRMLGRFALHRHGDDGLPLAPLTDTLDPPEGSGDAPNTENGND